DARSFRGSRGLFLFLFLRRNGGLVGFRFVSRQPLSFGLFRFRLFRGIAVALLVKVVPPGSEQKQRRQRGNQSAFPFSRRDGRRRRRIRPGFASGGHAIGLARDGAGGRFSGQRTARAREAADRTGEQSHASGDIHRIGRPFGWIL